LQNEHEINWFSANNRKLTGNQHNEFYCSSFLLIAQKTIPRILPYTNPLNKALRSKRMLVNSWPIIKDSQLPGNIGTGIRREATVNSEKKIMVINPFKFYSSISL